MNKRWWQAGSLWLGLSIAAGVLMVLFLLANTVVRDATKPYPPADPSNARSFEQRIAQNPLTLEQGADLAEQRFQMLAAAVRAVNPAIRFAPAPRDRRDFTRCVDGAGSRAQVPRTGPLKAPWLLTDAEWSRFPAMLSDALAQRGLRTEVVESRVSRAPALVTQDGFEIELAGYPSAGLLVTVTGPCLLPASVRDDVLAGK